MTATVVAGSGSASNRFPKEGREPRTNFSTADALVGFLDARLDWRQPFPTAAFDNGDDEPPGMTMQR